MGNESNPALDFLRTKHAGIMDNARQYGPDIGRNIASRTGNALLNAAGAGAVTGLAVAASKAYDAATKGRDFRTMLAHDPTLVPKHDADPRLFNQFYSTLRTFNPNFSRDPVVAAEYMHRMIDDPATAGGKIVDTLSFRDKMPNPVSEVLHGALKGTSTPSLSLEPREAPVQGAPSNYRSPKQYPGAAQQMWTANQQQKQQAQPHATPEGQTRLPFG